MICHYLYQKTADADPLEGFFELTDANNRLISMKLFQRFDVNWFQGPEHTTMTVTDPTGFPKLAITTNVKLPEGGALDKGNPLKMMRRGN